MNFKLYNICILITQFENKLTIFPVSFQIIDHK